MLENGPEWLPEISQFCCNKILLIFAIILTIIGTTMFTKMWKRKQQKIAENNPNPSKSTALPLCMDILLDTIEFFTPAQCEAVLLSAPNRTLCERLERRMAHFWWTEREAIAAQDLRISRRNAELCFRADFKKWLSINNSDKLLLVYAIQWRIVEAVEVPGIGQGDAIFVRAEWEEMDVQEMNLPWARKIGQWIGKPFKHSKSPHQVLTRRILIESRKVFFADKCVWRIMPMSITFKCFNEAGKERYHQGSGDPRWIVKKYCKNKIRRHFQCEYPIMAIRDQFTVDVKRMPSVWKKLMYEWKTTPPHPNDCRFENSDPPNLNIHRRRYLGFYAQDIRTGFHAGHLDVDPTDPEKFEYTFFTGNRATDSNVRPVPNGIQISTSRKEHARLYIRESDGRYLCPSNEWDGKIDFKFGFERFLPLLATPAVNIEHFEQKARHPDPFIHHWDTEHGYKTTLHVGHLDADWANSKEFEYAFTGVSANCYGKTVENGFQISTSRKECMDLAEFYDDGSYTSKYNNKISFVFGFKRFIPLVPTASVEIQSAYAKSDVKAVENGFQISTSRKQFMKILPEDDNDDSDSEEENKKISCAFGFERFVPLAPIALVEIETFYRKITPRRFTINPVFVVFGKFDKK